MTSSRRLAAVTAVVVVLLACAAPLGPASAAGPPATRPAEQAVPSPSASTEATGGPAVTEADAVALVLATDARFAGLEDYDSIRRRGAAEFKPLTLTTSYVRPLGGRRLALQDFELQPQTPAGYLIEVSLVRDCVEPTVYPGPDPCGWWHSWYYRVQPDGRVDLLYDEGLPDEPA